MKDRLIQNGIAVRASPVHGHGVFAEKAIEKGEIVEECRFLVTESWDSGLSDYYFGTGIKGKIAIMTGFGLLYNHADEPNLKYSFNHDLQVATFKAERTIQEGEELFIDYGKEWFSYRALLRKNENLKKAVRSHLSIYIRAFLVFSFIFILTRLLSH